jgi:hypothetical protein
MALAESGELLASQAAAERQNRFLAGFVVLDPVGRVEPAVSVGGDEGAPDALP